MKFKEYIYRYTYNILFYSDSGFGPFVAHRGPSWPIVGDRGPSWPIVARRGPFWILLLISVVKLWVSLWRFFWTSLGWAFALTSSWSKLASGGCPS